MQNDNEKNIEEKIKKACDKIFNEFIIDHGIIDVNLKKMAKIGNKQGFINIHTIVELVNLNFYKSVLNNSIVDYRTCAKIANCDNRYNIHPVDNEYYIRPVNIKNKRFILIKPDTLCKLIYEEMEGCP